jgi:putative flippase GtrA
MGPLLRTVHLRVQDHWRKGAISLKAVSFALVGVVNTVVDYSLFLGAQAMLGHSLSAIAFFNWLSVSCGCGSSTAILLIAANMMSWSIAVSGSYVMNSSITFAAESGRKLRWRSYFAFLASGIVGWLANTTTLLVAAQAFLLPIWLAKAIAVLASFVVNFSLSHFVVFRVRHQPAMSLSEDV